MNEQFLKEIIYSLSRNDCLWIICSILFFLFFNYSITKWIWNNQIQNNKEKNEIPNNGTEDKKTPQIYQRFNKNLRRKIRNEELAIKQKANAKHARNQRKEAYEAKKRLKEAREELYEKKINEKVLEKLVEKKKLLAQEQKEYERWKRKIDIQGTGNEFEFEDENLNNEYMNLSNFINVIISEKITNINDLSVEFRLSIDDVISRIRQLEEQNIIDGVLTDKGQYIFISEKEWEGINYCISKNGQVSKTKDLAQICNNLIGV